jgi:RNA polymerase primary sigma factor
MDTIRIYMKELVNNNSNQQETVILFNRYQAGDQDAKDLLITNYLRLVVKIANSYIHTGVDLADLISEGNVGLMTALEKYNPHKGAFSSFATRYIKNSIIRNCIMNKRVVRLPENITNLMSSNRWNGPNYSEYSIDKPNEEGDTLSDCIPETGGYVPFQTEESILMKKKIENILSFLPDRDSSIVKAIYGIDRDEPLDIEQVAELFNLSTTRISQILRSSIKSMRISHNSLPESNVKEVEIVNAKYGIDDKFIDVTDKVLDLYNSNENVKANNRLGGDPCPGVSKILTIQYIYNDTLLTKTFSEGSVLKF